VKNEADSIKINTGKITAIFAKTGNTLVREIKTPNGQVVGQNGKLILRSQSSVFDDEDKQGQPATDYFNFESNIDNVTVSNGNTARALVTVCEDHRQVTLVTLQLSATRIGFRSLFASIFMPTRSRSESWTL
jgi:hypothetical protein